MDQGENGLPRRRFLGFLAISAAAAAAGALRPAWGADAGVGLPTGGRDEAPSPRTAIVLFEKADELDVFGPREVFALANLSGMRKGSTYLVAERTGPVMLAHGTVVGADYAIADAPQPDILVVPGGPGVTAAMQRAELTKYIAVASRSCQWATSVCSGAMLLALAGVGAGRKMTTHRNWIEPLRRINKPELVLEGVRFVRDGNVVSSAGIASGIDMALWVAGQVYGEAAADRVKATMEYEPGPFKSET